MLTSPIDMTIGVSLFGSTYNLDRMTPKQYNHLRISKTKPVEKKDSNQCDCLATATKLALQQHSNLTKCS